MEPKNTFIEDTNLFHLSSPIRKSLIGKWLSVTKVTKSDLAKRGQYYMIYLSDQLPGQLEIPSNTSTALLQNTWLPYKKQDYKRKLSLWSMPFGNGGFKQISFNSITPEIILEKQVYFKY
jgi:hypothetical protein